MREKHLLSANFTYHLRTDSAREQANLYFTLRLFQNARFGVPAHYPDDLTSHQQFLVVGWCRCGKSSLRSSMTRFIRWIPITSPKPFKTFPQRLIRKWSFIYRNVASTTKRISRKSRYIVKSLTSPIAIQMGLHGARIVGVTKSGNTLLRLNKDCALGRKGTDLELPRDLVIFESVRRRGDWEPEESEFLALGVSKVAKIPNSKAALLDIGANTGLMTLQALNLSKTSIKVFLFEPIPRHVSAIKHNLRNLPDIHINEFALSNQNGKSEIFTQTTNHGNTSLLKSVVPSDELIRTKIQLVDTAEYCNNFLKGFDNYVIKCDTQGMDALILSRIPNRIWQRTEAAIIEVWALPEICEQDVTRMLGMCQNFKFASWHPKSQEKIGLNEISDFWLSKSGTFKNLFLSKTLPF